MLKTFRGGVHPHDSKSATANKPIVEAPLPDEVIIYLSQHIGAPCEPVVNKGDRVRTGQVVGGPQGFVSAPVHASITGTVAAVEPRPHPVLGSPSPAVVIKREGEEEWAGGTNEPLDPSGLSADEIKERILNAGIVGLGGAAFPTHVKLSPPPANPIDTIIDNGAECEPYLTCDNRLMIEKSKEIIQGLTLLKKVLGAKQAMVGIEANKPEAYERMKEAGKELDISVELLEVKYPQGQEHHLIKALLGREVPWHGGLPMAVGVLEQNIATAYAIQQAACLGRPLIQRVLTVTGDCIENPGNFTVRIGTPMSKLLELCGTKPGARRLIMGGPMMGLAQYTPDVATVKGTSGVLYTASSPRAEYLPCIRCGKCVQFCPLRLMPSIVSQAMDTFNVDVANRYNVLECKECGCCGYVCPSNRPIVQQVKLAKAELARRRASEKELASA